MVLAKDESATFAHEFYTRLRNKDSLLDAFNAGLSQMRIDYGDRYQGELLGYADIMELHVNAQRLRELAHA